MASQAMSASTAAHRTAYLPKKPTSGGTPASENINTSSASALPPSRLAKDDSALIWVTWRPSFSIDRMKAKVPMFIVT